MRVNVSTDLCTGIGRLQADVLDSSLNIWRWRTKAFDSLLVCLSECFAQQDGNRFPFYYDYYYITVVQRRPKRACWEPADCFASGSVLPRSRATHLPSHCCFPRLQGKLVIWLEKKHTKAFCGLNGVKAFFVTAFCDQAVFRNKSILIKKKTHRRLKCLTLAKQSGKLTRLCSVGTTLVAPLNVLESQMEAELCPAWRSAV